MDPIREAADIALAMNPLPSGARDLLVVAMAAFGRQCALEAEKAMREQSVAALKVWYQSGRDERWADEVVAQLPSLVPPKE